LLAMCGLGVAGEAGEVADIVKKYLYHDSGSLDRDHIIEELGDVLWYVAVAAHTIGVTLADVAHFNAEKLAKRYADRHAGTIAESRANAAQTTKPVLGPNISLATYVTTQTDGAAQ